MRKVKINVPETLNDIKLSQYKKFLRVTEGLEDERTINKRTVAVFCNLTDTIVNNMTKRSFDETLNQILKVLKGIDKDMELIRTFRYEGETYGFIPNMDDMTVGELADIDTNIGDWQKMDKVMSVLYRPTTSKFGDKYMIAEYKEGDKVIDPPLDVAFGAYFFLHGLLKDLLRYTPSCIASIVKRDPKSKSLAENGVGLNQFTDSLKTLCSGISKTLQL